MRDFNVRAARLYDLFVEELARWEMNPEQGSAWNDNGTLRYKYQHVIQNPPKMDYESVMVKEAVMHHDVVPTELAIKYIRYCAMEDALERLDV